MSSTSSTSSIGSSNSPKVRPCPVDGEEARAVARIIVDVEHVVALRLAAMPEISSRASDSIRPSETHETYSAQNRVTCAESLPVTMGGGVAAGALVRASDEEGS